MKLQLMAAGFILLASQAAAQDGCAPHDLLTEYLRQNFDAVRKSVALDEQGRMVEVFATDADGRWGLVVTTPDGIACLEMVGTGYEGDDEVLVPGVDG